MRIVLASLLIISLSVPAQAQDIDARLKVLEAKFAALVQAKVVCDDCQCGCCETGFCYCAKPHTYATALQTAQEERVPCVAFVGVPSRKIRGTVHTSVKAGRFSAEGYPSACIIVSNPDGSWRATLPATATDAEIEAALRPRVAAPPMALYAPLASAGGSC